MDYVVIKFPNFAVMVTFLRIFLNYFLKLFQSTFLRLKNECQGNFKERIQKTGKPVSRYLWELLQKSPFCILYFIFRI
jgi:hypothetical protein